MEYRVINIMFVPSDTYAYGVMEHTNLYDTNVIITIRDEEGGIEKIKMTAGEALLQDIYEGDLIKLSEDGNIIKEIAPLRRGEDQ